MVYEKMLPLIPLRDQNLVIFPGKICEIDVGRQFSIQAIIDAKDKDNKIIVAFQKSDSPDFKDFYNICIEALIKKIVVIKNKDASEIYRVTVIGINRAFLRKIEKNNKNNSYTLYGLIKINTKEQNFIVDCDVENKLKLLKEILHKYYNDIYNTIDFNPADDVSRFIDNIAFYLPISRENKLKILKINDVKSRLYEIINILSSISNEEPLLKNNQPEIVEFNDFKRLNKLISTSNLPIEVLNVANNELKKLKMMSPAVSEYHIIANYIELLVTLPWNNYTEDVLDIEYARECLDGEHFGLNDIKERILEFLAIKKLTNNNGTILCLVGPPGTGKTSICKSIAKSMGRKFVRMSLGGMNDEAEIRGHRRTYVGALPGKILQNIKTIGVNNPIFALDEIDKLSKNFRGDPASALLEVLDPEQNNSFIDNFFNVPFDLSKVIFIITANDLSAIPLALYDRMEIINISGYSLIDKLNIVQRYLFTKQKEKYGLKDYDISITDKAIFRIIEEYTNEAGVRDLERNCAKIIRKFAVNVISNKKYKSIIDYDDIPEILGNSKLYNNKSLKKPEVGVSTGLSCSENGGSILFIESSISCGNGEILLTGNLGKILQESAKTAHTWIKSNNEFLKISIEKILKNNIHIHLPFGAIPKDGPSAGIALIVSIISTIKNIPIKNNIAMTGEITLRGRVLPIGGLREKVLAACRAGIKEVIFPRDNIIDVESIPLEIRDNIKLTPIDNVKEAISIVFVE